MFHHISKSVIFHFKINYFWIIKWILSPYKYRLHGRDLVQSERITVRAVLYFVKLFFFDCSDYDTFLKNLAWNCWDSHTPCFESLTQNKLGFGEILYLYERGFALYYLLYDKWKIRKPEYFEHVQMQTGGYGVAWDVNLLNYQVIDEFNESGIIISK